MMPTPATLGHGALATEFCLATVTAYDADEGVKFQIDGQPAGMQKNYKTLMLGRALSVGARIVVMKQSGTYIVIGEITNATGGGSGGTTDYTQLSNKPRINSVTLTGNKSLSSLGALAAPETTGTAGQVLALDSDLNTVWADPGAGGGDEIDVTSVTSSTIASIASGATASFSATLSRTGYTPLGIVGYNFSSGSGVSTLNVYRMWLSDVNTAYAAVRAIGAAASNVAMTFYVLWKKT